MGLPLGEADGVEIRRGLIEAKATRVEMVSDTGRQFHGGTLLHLPIMFSGKVQRNRINAPTINGSP